MEKHENTEAGKGRRWWGVDGVKDAEQSSKEVKQAGVGIYPLNHSEADRQSTIL